MPSVSTLRASTRWIGSALAVVCGAVYLFAGMGAFFVGNARTVGGVVLWLLAVLALLSVLPLGIVAIFRPRRAALGIATSWAVLMISVSGSLQWEQMPRPESVSELLRPLVLYLALPLVVVVLLLYGSGTTAAHVGPKGSIPEEGAESSSTSKRALLAPFRVAAQRGPRWHAQWAAVLLGVLTGSFHLRVGVILAEKFARSHEWFSVAGVAASLLAPLPLAILGIWKPRVVGYLLVAGFALALVYPTLDAQNLGDALAYLAWASLLALPLPLTAGLFLYSSTGPSGRLAQTKGLRALR